MLGASFRQGTEGLTERKRRSCEPSWAVCNCGHSYGEFGANQSHGGGEEVIKTLKDLQFVTFCHFLADLLQEIATLSQTLQKTDLILPSAVAAVEGCLETMLETLITPYLEKQTPGAHTTTFQGIDLRRESESLMDNLRQQIEHASYV